MHDVLIQIHATTPDDGAGWRWQLFEAGQTVAYADASSIEQALATLYAEVNRSGLATGACRNPRARELAGVMNEIYMKAVLGTTTPERTTLALRRTVYVIVENLQAEADRLNLPARQLQRVLGDALIDLAGSRVERNSPQNVALRLRRFFDPDGELT